MLDAIAIVANTDKSSLRHENRCAWDYCRHYEEFFRDLRQENINLIEIGVAGGGSLDVWLRHFDRARIVGIDVDPKCARSARGRAEVRIGSQDDEPFLRSVAAEFPPTIVIDDGSHIAAHIIKSFEVLFPLVLPGGLYIIEDLVFHFNGDAGNISGVAPDPRFPSEKLSDFLNRIIVAKLAYANASAPYSEIDEVRIVGGAILIRKSRPRDHDLTKAALEQELDRLAAYGGPKYSYACFRMAEYLMTYHDAVDLALQYIEQGALGWQDNAYGLRVRRKALMDLGRHDEARDIEERLKQRGESPDLAEIFKRNYMVYPHK